LFGSRSDSEEVAALRLLDIERHALLMFTSCGWLTLRSRRLGYTA
jgi:uncharacterized protein DUF3536